MECQPQCSVHVAENFQTDTPVIHWNVHMKLLCGYYLEAKVKMISVLRCFYIFYERLFLMRLNLADGHGLNRILIKLQ